jgi:hypothetical protein
VYRDKYQLTRPTVRQSWFLQRQAKSCWLEPIKSLQRFRVEQVEGYWTTFNQYLRQTSHFS